MKTILPKLKIDSTTYLLLFIALLAGYIKNMFLVFLIVLIHECGHVFFFHLFHMEIESITIYPFGGVTYVHKKLHERIYKDVLISLGGILFQIALFFLFALLYRRNVVVSSTYTLFCFYNRNIILFNLIPIIPLDGSKLLFALFSKFFSYRKSYLFMIFLGMVSLVFFIGYNFLYQLNDFVLYIFLFYQLYVVIREYSSVMHKFYLERVLYPHYYNAIISGAIDIRKLRIDKFYYFDEGGKMVNEKEYIRRNIFYY